jgi:glucose/arabinose dehydrogenase
MISADFSLNPDAARLALSLRRHTIRPHSIGIPLATGLGLLASAAAAQVAPTGFTVDNPFPGVVFIQPVQIVFLPDGRHLVAEKSGRVELLFADGTIHTSPFAFIRSDVLSFNDRGFLSLAIDPDFDEDPWVYLLYVADPDADGFDDEEDTFARLTRFQVSAVNPNGVDYTTREVILGQTWSEGPPVLHTSHSVGTLRFADDGSLLLSVGDGARWENMDVGGQDPDAFGPGLTDPAEDIGAFRSRSLNSLAGKILRIDKDTGHGLPSNPFYDGDPTSKRSKVWTYGLRNGFRFALEPDTGSLDPADGDPGTIFVGDVGWATYEEIHRVPNGGRNLGWPCREGPVATTLYSTVGWTAAGNDSILCGEPLNDENPSPNLAPQLWWHHVDPALSHPSGWRGHSVTGGVFYEEGDYPASYHGAYFVSDFVDDWIVVMTFDETGQLDTVDPFISAAGGVVDMEIHPVTGDLWYIRYFDEEFRRVSYEPVVDVLGDGPVSPPTLLRAVRPNPFPAGVGTTISYELPDTRFAAVRIYNARGQLVRSLIESPHDPGPHEITWDGLTTAGHPADPGTYFLRLEAGTYVRSQKITVLP